MFILSLLMEKKFIQTIDCSGLHDFVECLVVSGYELDAIIEGASASAELCVT